VQHALEFDRKTPLQRPFEISKDGELISIHKAGPKRSEGQKDAKRKKAGKSKTSFNLSISEVWKESDTEDELLCDVCSPVEDLPHKKHKLSSGSASMKG
jgi:hypothetical protein